MTAQKKTNSWLLWCVSFDNDHTLMKKTALRNETYLRRFNEGMWLLMMSLLFCHHELSNSIQCELNKIVAMWVWSECHLIYDSKTVICSVVLWGEICLGHRKVHSHIQHHTVSFQERWSLKNALSFVTMRALVDFALNPFLRCQIS